MAIQFDIIEALLIIAVGIGSYETLKCYAEGYKNPASCLYDKTIGRLTLF